MMPDANRHVYTNKNLPHDTVPPTLPSYLVIKSLASIKSTRIIKKSNCHVKYFERIRYAS